MNTEDDEFARIEREQAMRNVPDPIHHTDTRESLEYITGWNDCRAAMLAEQPAPEEHVAEVRGDMKGGGYVRWLSEDYFEDGTKLYTSPPAQRKPLTDEEIWDEVKAADLDWQTGWSLDEDASTRYITFARAIEAAHGVKENT